MVIELDANAQPPPHLRVLFKKLQRCHADNLEGNEGILDSSTLASDHRVTQNSPVAEYAERLSKAFERFTSQSSTDIALSSILYFEVKTLPGLIIMPSVLPISVQVSLLDKLLCRDLCHPDHQTNLHLHYDLYRQVTQATQHGSDSASPSLFSLDPQLELVPKNPSIHKTLSVRQVLERKLRWVTFGGQYDWTNKVYPQGKPPRFPSDVADMLRTAFPDIEPQAAILNFYSPGDTLSIHRDVSEDCDHSLVSISIGCDALFFVANTDGSQSEVIRLRSGDAVLMSGKSRYAWHAVPKVLAGTCNDELRNWPDLRHGSDEHTQWRAQWRGWLGNKRINLNVRQMREERYEYLEMEPAGG